jgi:ribosome-associated translation inhibitor RaiA
MNADALKTYIKKKFGSLSKFAVLAKIDRYEVQKVIAAAKKNTGKYKGTQARAVERGKKIDEFYALAERTPADYSDDEITPALRKLIEKKIKEFGGIQQFCQEFPQFKYINVYQTMTGERSKLTTSVRELLTTLRIETNGNYGE